MVALEVVFDVKIFIFVVADFVVVVIGVYELFALFRLSSKFRSNITNSNTSILQVSQKLCMLSNQLVNLRIITNFVLVG